MNQTKDEILKSALRLFNEMGVAQVSLRTIAGDMGISLGNLTYHFKKREEIIEALYLALVEKLDQMIGKELDAKSQFELLFRIPSVTISGFYEYRFLMLDFVFITRNHEMIKRHYQKLMTEREQQFASLVRTLVEAKFLRDEQITDEYRFLFQNLRVVSDFWLSANSIDKNGALSPADLENGTQTLEYMILPYLTQEGLQAYLQLRAIHPT